MADQPTLDDLITQHQRLYGRMVDTFRVLPVPIHLPIGLVTTNQCAEALERVLVIAEDQPMPDRRRDDVHLLCVAWLVAADLIGLEVEGRRPWDRHFAIRLNLAKGTALVKELNRWIGDPN